MALFDKKFDDNGIASWRVGITGSPIWVSPVIKRTAGNFPINCL
jgi:hypothetical protein